MIYKLLKKKIEREGWSEENQNLLDIFLLAGRITKAQYYELTLIGD